MKSFACSVWFRMEPAYKQKQPSNARPLPFTFSYRIGFFFCSRPVFSLFRFIFLCVSRIIFSMLSNIENVSFFSCANDLSDFHFFLFTFIVFQPHPDAPIHIYAFLFFQFSFHFSYSIISIFIRIFIRPLSNILCPAVT